MIVNEIATETVMQEESAPTHAGPGHRLRKAREEAGLTIEAVAADLRLRPELIQALEADDRAHLPSRAFVSGYVRSYARLLGLAGEELVALLDQPAQAAALVLPVMPPQSRRSSDLPVKAVSYLIVVLLVLLSGVWWWSRPSQPAPTVEVQVDTPAAKVEPSAAVAPVEQGTNLLTPGTTVPLELPQPNVVSSGELQVDAAKMTTPPPAAPITAATEVLLEATSGDCWIDIRDADGKQLMYDMLKQGSTRTLRGKAPFAVFLGYAPAVTVIYQGQVFDHATYQRRDVARFRLGKSADNKPLSE